ncbi:MAG: transposase, partial [Anaerolineae bacterium]|nr:transposase [Anaerolineae bacterium]
AWETYYHIYNRGNNRENLFRCDENYRYFLRLYAHHIEPVAETYAYCLMPNHFHLLLRTREQGLTGSGKRVRSPSQAFSNLFNAYTKAFNKAHGRSGALFQRPFQRIPVTSEAYLRRLVVYIHQNPVRHGFVDQLSEWPYSSYAALLSTKPTHVARDAVLEWLGGAANVPGAHSELVEWLEEDKT